MKEQIKKIDRLLAEMVVKGDSVLLLADARTLLGKLYRMACKAEQTEENSGSSALMAALACAVDLVQQALDLPPLLQGCLVGLVLNDLICGLRDTAENSHVSTFALGSLSDLLDGITRDLEEKFEGGSPRKEEAQT